MPTTLVVAEPKDRLAQRVCDMIPNVIRCTERELFATCGFSLLQDGTSVEGSLMILGRALPLAQLSGVLFRPVRRWRPPSQLGARHRAFVKHETQAAWCAVLNALPCPVLNRMAPAWWYDAKLYSAYLTQAFARRLGLPISPCGDRSDRRDLHGSETRLEKPTSLYAVGKHVVAIDPISRALRSRLAAEATKLKAWQRATGIGFARIDFAHGGDYAVEHIEPFPVIGHTPEAVLDGLSRRIAKALA
jgi:hypothetical protein